MTRVEELKASVADGMLIMYEEHKLFRSPPDSAILRRYMDFTQFVFLLEKEVLFL